MWHLEGARPFGNLRKKKEGKGKRKKKKASIFWHTGDVSGSGRLHQKEYPLSNCGQPLLPPRTPPPLRQSVALPVQKWSIVKTSLLGTRGRLLNHEPLIYPGITQAPEALEPGFDPLSIQILRYMKSSSSSGAQGCMVLNNSLLHYHCSPTVINTVDKHTEIAQVQICVRTCDLTNLTLALLDTISAITASLRQDIPLAPLGLQGWRNSPPKCRRERGQSKATCFASSVLSSSGTALIFASKNLSKDPGMIDLMSTPLLGSFVEQT